jgi:hypothetical protein
VKLIMEGWRDFVGGVAGATDTTAPGFSELTTTPIIIAGGDGQEKAMDMPYHIIEVAVREGKSLEDVAHVVMAYLINSGEAQVGDQLSAPSLKFIEMIIANVRYE